MANREIKFRSKRLDNGEWVYGHYTEGSPNYHYITNPNGAVWQVDPETIGEYCGLKDKSGNEIYEGDLVKGTFSIRTGTDVRTYKRTKSSYAIYSNMEVTGIITFNETLASFYFDTNFKQSYKTNFWAGMGSTQAEKRANEWTDTYDSPKDYLHKVATKIEVIGNIFQNKIEDFK